MFSLKRRDLTGYSDPFSLGVLSRVRAKAGITTKATPSGSPLAS